MNKKVHRAITAAAWLALLGGGAIRADDPKIETFDPRHAFSVGCAAANGGNVVYVWHGGGQLEGDRAFKFLAAPDFEACLSEIARTRPGLYEALLSLNPQSSGETRQQVMKDATAVWAERGVYAAVEEVGSINGRGPKVEALLRTCDDLRRKREAR